MDFLKAVILGIIQGLTEFLPVSSSGHLSVAQHFMGIKGDSSLMLSVMLHLGTLLAVFIIYYKTFWDLILEMGKVIKDIFTRKFSFNDMSENRHLLIMLIISCIPLLILLFPIGNGNKILDIVSYVSGDNDIILEGFGFLITATLLLLSTYIYNKKYKTHKKNAEPNDAFAVGFAQLIATLPGISRSGSTITTGMLCGVDKKYMVRYSFVLGTPAIIAANLMEFKEAIHVGFDVNVLAALLGVAVACIVGIMAIKLTIFLVDRDKFKYFGYYCLVLGIIVITAGLVEKF